MSHLLPPPKVILARWGTLAATLAAIGRQEVWWIDREGAHYDDGGGGNMSLLPVQGGRAVLVGYDRGTSRTAWATPPLDLLADAPVWVPWPVLIRRDRERRLGYVYWYEHGTWSRVPYPSEMTDGLENTAAAVLDEQATIELLREVVIDWCSYDSGRYDEHGDVEEPAIVQAARDLLAAAHARRVDRTALTGLLGRLEVPFDPAAGLEAAALAGLVPDSRPPGLPASATVPARRVRVLSDNQLARLLRAAMRNAREIPRPAPPQVPELDALVTWARDHAPAGDGRSALLIMLHDHGAQFVHHPDAPRDLTRSYKLVEALREAGAHRDHGRWFHLRLDTTATGHTVRRWYDSTPDWMPEDILSLPGGLDTEMNRRAPAFRPPWTILLEEHIVYTGPPAPYDTLL
ncbi:hypothetical protein [Saccharothrix xinjiangensis]|uniref:Uncharacterized protein n=1 Tax=Saccharothrix xinjiangensis TaxID=204798 RepID=A0ABV9Y0S1_9PSEU